MTLSVERLRVKYEIDKRAFREFKASDRVDFVVPFVYEAKKGVEA